MDKLEKLKAAYKLNAEAMQVLLDGSEDALTDEQQAEFDGMKVEADSLKSQITNVEAAMTAKAEAEALADRPAPAGAKLIQPDLVVLDNPAAGAVATTQAIVISAIAKRFATKLVSFKGENAQERAFKAGQFFRAIGGNVAAIEFCNNHGMPIIQGLNQSEGVNADGGYLVPEEIDIDIINLVEDFGLYRQKARRVPMLSDTKKRNKSLGGITATFTAEGAAAAASKKTWAQFTLIAKKITALTTITDELSSDAIINVADDIVKDIALAYATKEDQCGFNGDGTAGDGSIDGILPKLLTINGVDDGGGLVLASGNLMSEITLADHLKMIGRVKQVAGVMFEWYCSQVYFATVMQRLEIGGAGNTIATTKDGARQLLHLGYPVNIVNVMSKVDANSQVPCIFGDIRLSADFGDRLGQTISFSRDATIDGVNMFETGQLAVKGTERFDINNHSLGSATEAEAIIGLVTAAG